MDLNSTHSAVRDLAQRLFGNNSLLSFDNDTVASKTEEEDLEVNTDVYSRVIVTVIYVALFAAGSLGNAITLYTLLTKKTLQNLQSTVHYHLASLAVSDLLILVLSMPIELYNFIWFHHPWVFGDALCRGYYFLRDSCSYATALNIASLSVERYMAICHPFKAKSIMSRSRTKKLISAMWIASFALATPMLFVMGQKMRNGEKICTSIVAPVTIKAVLQVGVGKMSKIPLLPYRCLFMFTGKQQTKRNHCPRTEDADSIKGAICSFGEETQTQNCNIYNINEVILQPQSAKYTQSKTD